MNNKNLLRFISKYKEFNFCLILLNFFYYKIFHQKKILVNKNVVIKGVKNLYSNDFLEIGLNNNGFTRKGEYTFLNLSGKLKFKGKYSIGRGCKIDVGKGAEVQIGSNGYINSNSKLIITNKLTIGDNCIISWDCQFLDNDFHEIRYLGKKVDVNNEIFIGNNVWIGCGVKIYKGTYIPDGCVIASDSVVKGIFKEEKCLIGGYPAKVLKSNVEWC
ncbi:acyltransferase [Aestuariibaculum sediminum]|uniref:Acyltransferase n=1 Tax=Aestuariibaculum sediminum TaxID=2770637 RepID=A0A8J6PYP7_9FLAO|nr:acyltransferase [Aestuariibaculum sediminum]MBD0831217.1 hypothetical protein [Aestuariibaculum sediminum]